MKRRQIFLLPLCLLAGSMVRADVGLTGAQTFQRSVAARPAGMGEAYSAVDGDLDGLTFNPAGVAGMPSSAITSSYQYDFAKTNFGTLQYGHSVPFGTIYVGGSYFDAGTVELNQSNGFQGTVHAQQDMTALIGLAMGKKTPLAVGVTGKFLRSELAETATASTYALDAGVLWRTGLSGLSLGGAVQNVGPEIKYESEGDPLPTTVRAGAAYLLDLQELGVFKDFAYTFLFTVDGVKVRDTGSGVRAGFEMDRRFIMMESAGHAALRAGYRSDGQMFDIGIGFLIESVSLDYALHLISDLDPGHRLTLGYHFAAADH